MRRRLSKTLAVLALLLATGAVAQESEDADDPIAALSDLTIDCAKPTAFDPLFDLSAAGTVEGAEDSEALAKANEDAFLKCPRQFLAALKDQPRTTQDGVLNYFGLSHPPSQLGEELRKWKNHPQVGPLVRSRFTALLETKP